MSLPCRRQGADASVQPGTPRLSGSGIADAAQAPDHAPCAARRRLLGLLAAWPCVAAATRAAQPLPPELKGELDSARLLGEARLRYLGLHVYDIRLWGDAGLGGRDPVGVPLALELQYARALEGKSIAERSLKEMQGLGSIGPAQAEQWLQQMRQIFPDVNKGDRITGVQRPGEAARFFVNGQPRGEVRDADFTRLFFGIWLSPHTSQPRLREALLGTRSSPS